MKGQTDSGHQRFPVTRDSTFFSPLDQPTQAGRGRLAPEKPGTAYMQLCSQPGPFQGPFSRVNEFSGGWDGDGGMPRIFGRAKGVERSGCIIALTGLSFEARVAGDNAVISDGVRTA